MSIKNPAPEVVSLGDHNPYLYPGIEAIQAFGDLGHNVLELSLAPSQLVINTSRIMAEFCGVKETLLLDVAKRTSGALLEISKQIIHDYPRPEFNLETITIDTKEIPIIEIEELVKPFSRRVHFDRQFEHDDEKRNDPKVLIVAALSGHPATLHRPTVEELLPNTDLHIIRWEDAKDVSIEAGRFGLDEYIDDVIDNILDLGPDSHVIAVCQSAGPVSAALSIIAEMWPDKQPLSLTLISGPVDSSINAEASKISDFVKKQDVESLRRNFIGEVTSRYAGVGREVYPGDLQKMAFYTLNIHKHFQKHQKQFTDRVLGNDVEADKTGAFYPVYNTMLDMTGEFYTETFETFFEQPKLANGTMEYNGIYGHRIIDLSSVDTYLMTIEGGVDEFCPLGQTSAAHKLFSTVPHNQRSHYELVDGGHYATWAGSGFTGKIAPRLRDLFIKSAEAKKSIKYSEPTLPVIECEPWHIDYT